MTLIDLLSVLYAMAGAAASGVCIPCQPGTYQTGSGQMQWLLSGPLCCHDWFLHGSPSWYFASSSVLLSHYSYPKRIRVWQHFCLVDVHMMLSTQSTCTRHCLIKSGVLKLCTACFYSGATTSSVCALCQPGTYQIGFGWLIWWWECAVLWRNRFFSFWAH